MRSGPSRGRYLVPGRPRHPTLQGGWRLSGKGVPTWTFCRSTKPAWGQVAGALVTGHVGPQTGTVPRVLVHH